MSEEGCHGDKVTKGNEDWYRKAMGTGTMVYAFKTIVPVPMARI